MSKILFALRQEKANPVLDKKLKEKFDCDFVSLNAKAIIEKTTQNKTELVILYLSKLTDEEDLELRKYLQNSEKTAIVLAGERFELERFYQKTKANIVRYIKTPILFSDYVEEIKIVLGKVEKNLGIETANETANEELQIIEKAEPKHILIVDDDVVMLRTINNWLNALFKVSVAKSGTQALQFLAKEKPDLILLDYEMPICDGIQTLKMIRSEESTKDIPVFFLTAVDDLEFVKKALELKPQGYILKSKGSDYLTSKIEEYF